MINFKELWRNKPKNLGKLHEEKQVFSSTESGAALPTRFMIITDGS